MKKLFISYNDTTLIYAAEFIWENNKYCGGWNGGMSCELDLYDYMKKGLYDLAHTNLGIENDDYWTSSVTTGGYTIICSKTSETATEIHLELSISVDPAVGMPCKYILEEI
jgi:hypothetical protein